MNERHKPAISPRKQPRQARSTELVSAILQAAAQVLAKEGAHRFTTARVAEAAGVSIGSLYQYFPNKAAILFRLQSDEWKQTADKLVAILENPALPPLDRLYPLAHAFLCSECEEAAMRSALDDAAPLYRDAEEARSARAYVDPIVAAYIGEVLPQADAAERALAAEVLLTTLSTVGKRFSELAGGPQGIDRYAQAMSRMLRGYFEGAEA